MKVLNKKIGVTIKLSRDYNSYQISEEITVEYNPGEESQLNQIKEEMKSRIRDEVKREIDMVTGIMKAPFSTQPMPPINPQNGLVLPQETQVRLPM